MSISGFGRPKGGSELPPTQAPKMEAPGALTAFIDQGSRFEGKLSFKDTVRIDGGFEGEITSENTLIIGETGEVHASIQSQVVVVSGAVVGDIVADRQVVLHKGACLTGDVKTPSLIVEDGAQLNGQLTMTGGTSAPAKSAPPLKAVGSQAVGSSNTAQDASKPK